MPVHVITKLRPLLPVALQDYDFSLK